MLLLLCCWLFLVEVRRRWLVVLLLTVLRWLFVEVGACCVGDESVVEGVEVESGAVEVEELLRSTEGIRLVDSTLLPYTPVQKQGIRL